MAGSRDFIDPKSLDQIGRSLTPPTVAADLDAQMRGLVDFLTGALEAECTEAAV